MSGYLAVKPRIHDANGNEFLSTVDTLLAKEPSATYKPVDLLHETYDYNFQGKLSWKFRNALSRFWLWEFSACAFSLILLAVIYISLDRIDGMNTFDWHLRWSPTSVLAFGVTMMKAAMMICVAASLGNLKWYQFRKPESLQGLEDFGSASKGSLLASIKLLINLKWHLASVGALITISALSLDTLVQNTVQVHNRTMDNSYVLHTNSYTFVSTFNSGPEQELPPSNMASALSYAMTTRNGLSSFLNTLAFCPSNQCMFGNYQTLGVDAQCINRTLEPSSRTVVHPGDPTFYLDVGGGGIINSTTLFDYPPKDYFDSSALGPLITRWLVLTNNNTLDGSVLAMDCVFSWSVQTLNSNVTNGTYHQTLVEKFTNTSDRDITAHEINILPERCWANGSLVPNSTPGCLNTVLESSHRSLQNYFRSTSFSLKGYAINTTRLQSKETYWSSSNIFMQALLPDVTNVNTTTAASILERKADNIAFMIANFIRQQPIFTSKNSSALSKLPGITIYPSSVYRINWIFFIPPSAMVIVSALFLLSTFIITRDQPPWKGSELALLFHGLSPRDGREMGTVRNEADMREIAKQAQVKLVNTEVGEKLVTKEVLASGSVL